jgi:hypothetical protein
VDSDAPVRRFHFVEGKSGREGIIDAILAAAMTAPPKQQYTAKGIYHSTRGNCPFCGNPGLTRCRLLSSSGHKLKKKGRCLWSAFEPAN